MIGIAARTAATVATAATAATATVATATVTDEEEIDGRIEGGNGIVAIEAAVADDDDRARRRWWRRTTMLNHEVVEVHKLEGKCRRLREIASPRYFNPSYCAASISLTVCPTRGASIILIEPPHCLRSGPGPRRGGALPPPCIAAQSAGASRACSPDQVVCIFRLI
mmetsp:Transcript_87300/g.191862  ORF Transcript_87300/g.191862 Transcript_87300/m.191862 type:complete len:166 (-) Transcript_87300:70-567(-)